MLESAVERERKKDVRMSSDDVAQRERERGEKEARDDVTRDAERKVNNKQRR